MLDILHKAGRALDSGVQPYSGRAMYGRTCAGIWGELTDVLEAVVRASPSTEVAAELVKRVNWDSPVVYWPDIPCDKHQVTRKDIEEAGDNGVDSREDLCATFGITEEEFEEIMA